MSFDPSKDIIRTDSGDPIPQIWNDEEQIFVPYEGKVQLSGNIVASKVESRSGLLDPQTTEVLVETTNESVINSINLKLGIDDYRVCARLYLFDGTNFKVYNLIEKTTMTVSTRIWSDTVQNDPVFELKDTTNLVIIMPKIRNYRGFRLELINDTDSAQEISATINYNEVSN